MLALLEDWALLGFGVGFSKETSPAASGSPCL